MDYYSFNLKTSFSRPSNLKVPYNVAFKNKTSEDVFLLVVDSIVDVIFFIDIGKFKLLLLKCDLSPVLQY